jgi:hypothetical protein
LFLLSLDAVLDFEDMFVTVIPLQNPSNAVVGHWAIFEGGKLTDDSSF